MAQTINVDISTRGAPPVAYTHQGDTDRTFLVNVFENGEAFGVAGFTVKVAAILPGDGGYTVISGADMVSATKTTTGTNQLMFTPSAQYTARSGRGILTLIMTTNTGTPATLRPINIDFRIQKSADGPDVIAGASDFPEGLEEIAEQVFQEYLSTYLPPVAPSSSADANKAASAKLTGQELDNLKSDLSQNVFDQSFADSAFETGSAVYDLTYTNSAMNDTTGQQSVASSKRASTPALYYFSEYCELHASWNATNQAIWIYCFDKDKSYLGYVGANQISNGIVSLKNGTRYIRFLISNKNDSDISVSDAKQYATYTCVYIGRLTNTDTELNMLSEKVDKIVVNNNLLAGYEMNNGYFNGSPRTSPDYVYFAKIPVENGKTYITYPTSRMVYIYASDGSLINYLNQQDITSITADGDGYAYVTYYASANLESIGFYEANADDVYGRNSYALAKNIIIPSILTGKKWAVLGDSFTAGADTGTIQSGTYAGQKIVYPYLIGNRTGINVLSFFAGGRTLAYPAVPGGFINSVTCPNQPYYYQNIPADADYVTIYLGINDSHHAPDSGGGDGEDNTGVIPIGTITDNTTSTFYGAWNVVLTWLKTNRPFAHIGIIVSNGCETEEYRTATIAIAKKYGVPYIDFNGDERTAAMIRPQNADIATAVKTILLQTQAVDYAGGNYHPNNSAHEMESYVIENFLRSI